MHRHYVCDAASTGQLEWRWLTLSKQHNGLLFTEAEVKALNDIATKAGLSIRIEKQSLKSVQV